MAQIRGEIVIHRPIDEVFDFVADERNEPRYNPKMIRVDKLIDGPIGEGTRFRATVKSARGSTDMLIENTGHERPHRLSSTTTLDSMTIRGTLRFDSLDGATRMRWTWDLEPHGALRLLSPVVAALGRRSEREIWTSLKRVLEDPSAAVDDSKSH